MAADPYRTHLRRASPLHADARARFDIARLVRQNDHEIAIANMVAYSGRDGLAPSLKQRKKWMHQLTEDDLAAPIVRAATEEKRAAYVSRQLAASATSTAERAQWTRQADIDDLRACSRALPGNLEHRPASPPQTQLEASKTRQASGGGPRGAALAASGQERHRSKLLREFRRARLELAAADAEAWRYESEANAAHAQMRAREWQGWAEEWQGQAGEWQERAQVESQRVREQQRALQAQQEEQAMLHAEQQAAWAWQEQHEAQERVVRQLELVRHGDERHGDVRHGDVRHDHAHGATLWHHERMPRGWYEDEYQQQQQIGGDYMGAAMEAYRERQRAEAYAGATPPRDHAPSTKGWYADGVSQDTGSYYTDAYMDASPPRQQQQQHHHHHNLQRSPPRQQQQSPPRDLMPSRGWYEAVLSTPQPGTGSARAGSAQTRESAWASSTGSIHAAAAPGGAAVTTTLANDASGRASPSLRAAGVWYCN